MDFKIWNLFKKKNDQPQAPPERHPAAAGEEAAPEVNQELLRIMTSKGGFGPDDYVIILAQTKPVKPEEIRTAQWERIRCICASDGFVRYGRKGPEPGWHLSHDGSWLIITDGKANLSSLLKLCSRNLIFLRIDVFPNSPLDLSPMKQLRHLIIQLESPDRQRVIHLDGLELMTSLEELVLYGTFNFSELDISRMKGLKVLELCDNLNLANVTGLELTGLRKLVVFEIGKLKKLDLSCLEELEELELGYLPCLQRFPALNRLSKLKLLGLYSLLSIQAVDLTGLKMLELLNLYHCRSLRYIAGLETLDHLTMLRIEGAAIRSIPDALRNKPLKMLCLENLELEELPDWLPELKLPFSNKYSFNSIFLRGTTVRDVDMSIFDQPQEMILQWFEERKKKDNLVRLNEIKVVFLGDGEAGKSHTIARLLNDGGAPLEYTDQSTPGIVIKNKEYDLDGRRIQVHYWDFGGQEILHSMHRIFLTERTLYVVLVNARDETQDARARYWLHNIKSFAKDAPVLLVLNKIDQNPNARVNEPELRSKYPNLRQVVAMSALKDSPEAFDGKFTRVLLDEIRKTGYLDVQWPIPWTRVKGELETMPFNYIQGEQYKDICRRHSVDRNEKNLLHWFNDLGVSYCCCDDYRLEDYMILKPDWITNALYIILFNHCPGARNGLIPHESIYGLLCREAVNAEQIRRVLPGVYYGWNEISFVLEVFHKAQLSFRSGADHEFIPMLCDPASSPVALEYERDESTLEFRMDFEYLPNNLLHQLMVDRKVELQMDHVWRTGALFAQAETGYSAVVAIDDNTLKILVRHSDGMHRPNTYLAMLKANIDRIWQKMGLKEPKNRLVYKIHGQRAEFSYEKLLKMHARGKREEFCEELDRDFLIEDVLNQAAPDSTGDQKALLYAIIQACQSLQGNRKCWEWNENDRNTAVRDFLRVRGYTVNDQTLQGVSGSGNGTGELDLDIRITPNTPWTVCEALIVEGYSKNWHKHMSKLLCNYNPYGLPVLYLLTYVDCAQEKFGAVWEKYRTHIRESCPDDFEIIPESVQMDLFSDYESTRAAVCRYRRGSYTPAVYHIFVRIGP